MLRLESYGEERRLRFYRFKAGGAAGLLMAVSTGWCAQQAPAVDAKAIVTRAVQHRTDADKEHRMVEYRYRKVDDRGDTTKEVVETKDGNVSRLVAIGGRPLNTEQEQAEIERLHDLAGHPEMMARRHKNEDRDRAQINRMMAMLPDAFLYKVVAMVPCASGECYKMTYTPNPGWTPPDMEAKVLRGIAGEVLIDTKQERLVRLEANFIQDVDFGLVLAKMNKGGHVVLEQADIGNGVWELTGMTTNLSVKILLLKRLNLQITEEMSEFRPVDQGMDFRGAIDLLTKPGTVAAK
jgi:hypothetical protein